MLLEQEVLELIKNNKIKFYKVACSILNNEEDVNDAIQETMISAYNKIDTLKNRKYLETWITRILINKCYDIIDKNKTQERKINKMIEHFDDSYENDIEQKSIVQKAVQSIDEDLRTIVVLYYYNQFSIKDISKIMDIPNGTVKSKLLRARNKLYDILKSEVEENEQD